MLTTLVAVLFSLVLVAGVPALSYSTARNSEIRTMPRLGLYLSATFSQWLLTIIGLGVVYVAARPVFVRGFAVLPLVVLIEWGAGIAATSLLALGIVALCERQGWLPPESSLVYLLVPHTLREKLWAALIISPTAAFCEEFLYRGFLLTVMQGWFHSLAGAWVVSSVAFGLAHCYQGWSGMTRAALLGALLACPVVRLGNLYPAMLAHWLIDTVALLWLAPWLLPNEAPAEGLTS